MLCIASQCPGDLRQGQAWKPAQSLCGEAGVTVAAWQGLCGQVAADGHVRALRDTDGWAVQIGCKVAHHPRALDRAPCTLSPTQTAWKSLQKNSLTDLLRSEIAHSSAVPL